MKTKRFFLLSVFLLTTLFGMMADDDKPIGFNSLPENSKAFVKSYFDEKDIAYATVDRDLFSKSYEVFFVNGSKVEFDSRGEWETVDCFKQAIPAGIVPAAIVEYIEKNHSGFFIVQIERDRKDYEVELNNELEIKFDKKFNVIRYDH